jgi:hypothetical protein
VTHCASFTQAIEILLGNRRVQRVVRYQCSNPNAPRRHAAIAQLLQAGFHDMVQNIKVLDVCDDDVAAALELLHAGLGADKK